MAIVSCSRLRIYRAGGNFGAGGTALDANGELAIPHGLAVPTRTGAILDTSSQGTTTQVNRTVITRISGVMAVVQVESALVACASVTANGWWWAEEGS